MRNLKAMGFLTALLMVAMLAVGCDDADANGANGDEDNGAESNTNAQVGDVAVDISEFGMMGTQFVGPATLSEQKLVFDDSEVEISTIVFSMITSIVVLDEFDSPELEYEGVPARLRVHLNGEVQDHSPGEFVVSLTGVSLRILDSDDQQLGTDSAEELVEGLAANGVSFPEGVTSADPLEVTFGITANDEDYSEIYMSSDAPFFESFVGVEK